MRCAGGGRTANGIFPGRATWVRDARVTPWDGKTGRCWEEGNINQPVFNAMLANSLNSLTGETSGEQAWDALFPPLQVACSAPMIGAPHVPNRSHARRRVSGEA
jgi:hypothetical protein